MPQNYAFTLPSGFKFHGRTTVKVVFPIAVLQGGRTCEMCRLHVWACYQNTVPMVSKMESPHRSGCEHLFKASTNSAGGVRLR